MSTLSRLFMLAALGYLGFYVFGLVTGVFTPGELVALTVLALGIVAMFAILVIRDRIRDRRAGPHTHTR
jgi:hypothetical protein